MASIYFSLLELYQKIVDRLNGQCPQGNYFKTFRSEFDRRYNFSGDYSACRTHADYLYTDFYNDRKEELSPYFKIVYRILRVVDKSDLDESEKFEFVTMFRSQLGENEMFAMYYNSHSVFGEEFYRFVLRFNLLKHLPALSKVELARSARGVRSTSKLLHLNRELALAIQDCVTKLSSNIMQDDFDEARCAIWLSFNDSVMLVVRASEVNELTVEFDSEDIEGRICEIFNSVESFCMYGQRFLYDIFICSRYLPKIEEAKFVSSRIEAGKIVFNVTGAAKLTLNVDREN
nr:putative phage abortive infection protein [Pseudomonas coleopterorum]